ncbi:RNA-binding protein 4.1-like isoform X3 [Actinia tenebrosa]|uniref:RNA-binding protein 4.1-like isoform X3 n=1 Tax=Actinia tenebrosa TaxID=6105 RepID=A0A6P8I9E9_ACTTE|nr:RNA-binding protein 4.1-like isoform X3 [Actinia tenebrosa]
MTEPNETVGEVSSEALTQTTGDSASNVENGQNENTTEEVRNDENETKGPTPSAPNELKLYVGNLPDNCVREDLQTLFSKYGDVSQCDRVKNFAFVHMVGEENARKAISALDDSEFMGTHIQVQIAKSKGKPAEDECFQCGKRGHWAKDCSQRRSGPYRRSGGRYDNRSAPYSYGPRRDPYSRGPAPRDYDYYYDRRGPRDYGGAPPYRSRSPAGYDRRSPDYSMGYEGYGPPRSGYGVRS